MINDGYCIFEDILTRPFLSQLRGVVARLQQSDPSRRSTSHRAQGEMRSAMADPLFADLISWAPALNRLSSMGFQKPTYTDGYIISKPPKSPPLFWHYDWFAWQDPRAYDTVPQQVFLMYYLTDTSVDNGCLRVIPGSHQRHNVVHEHIGNPHSGMLSRAEDLDQLAFSMRPDEVDVPVRAGDLVIGDARLLHAAHANNSSEWRTVITLWFQPAYASLPDRVKAQMVEKIQKIPADWPVAATTQVQVLHPTYTGKANPYVRDLYRKNPAIN
ncbi:MAG: phytanoyl-CoA dioxygenase family protein [Pseudomonadales bacterium]